MKTIAKRLAALEAIGTAASTVWHNIIQEVGETQDEALDAYGRDRIADGDNLIVRKIVEVPTKHERIEK